MDFYPYLERYVAFDELQGKKVLEVGLGYGTVGQKIAESGADYTGLDIAEGPVSMMNHRLGQCGLPGKAIQGSILEAPFEDETFDRVVAIGCYHHTGDTKRAISETARILKPGGQALVMVYNAYSYRRWLRSPLDTWRYYRDDNDDGIKNNNAGFCFKDSVDFQGMLCNHLLFVAALVKTLPRSSLRSFNVLWSVKTKAIGRHSSARCQK